MDTQFKILFFLIGANTLANVYFLCKYGSLEYGIQTNTDIIIRKIIELESKINLLTTTDSRGRNSCGEPISG
jgi:hypothetical protein